MERGERGDAVERALETADVGLDPLGDEAEHGIGELFGHVGHLVAQDGKARLGIGRLQLGGEAHLEAGGEPLFEIGDFGRGASRW